MRVPNWDVRLAQWARSVIGEPFAWGKTDCGSLFVQALDAMLVDSPDDLPTYKSLKGAKGAFEATGGPEGVLRDLDAVGVALSTARQGDFLIVDDEPFPATCVIVGRSVLVANEDTGVYMRPLRDFTASEVLALRVPLG